MVITKDMPVSGIVSNWSETKEVFNKYAIPVDSNKSIKEFLTNEKLDLIITELNQFVGSSSVTCVEGG